MAFFEKASGNVIVGSTFVNKSDGSKDLTPLYNKVAPNAILNSGGRADPVRCHPGTREEVIAKMEKRIRDIHTGDRGIFWLSGPAGAGKSAIMQTVAERCNERKVPMVNFFFFRADSTRNHSDPVVATLLFQLFEIFPTLKPHVAAVASHNPVIFRQSMREQFSSLIEKPLQLIHPGSRQTPLVILIDGLDECSSGNGKDDQVSLLNILHGISTHSVSLAAPAYVVLVASRTEAHLTKAFNEIGCHPYSIYLDKSYSPSVDIRKFLIHEFSRIKRTHNLKDTLPENWPLSSDIDALVEKSSGQFVYPSTVTRFISDSSASPKRSLEIVLGLRPPTRTSPFATLDALYSHILFQAEDWSSVRDILAVQRIFDSSRFLDHVNLMTIITPMGYTQEDVLSSLSDLTAIIQAGITKLTIYHASLSDFLVDRGRSAEFYIDVNAVACKLAPLYFKQSTDKFDIDTSFCILRAVKEPDTELTDFLKLFLPDTMSFDKDKIERIYTNAWIEILAWLYKSCDVALYETLRKKWEEWINIVNSSVKVVSRQPSLRSFTLPMGHYLSESSTNGNVAGKAMLVQAPTVVTRQGVPHRPSTPLSRFFAKFTPQKNQKTKK